MNCKLYVVIDNFVSLMQCALDATDIDAAILPSLLLRSRQHSSTLSRGDRLGDWSWFQDVPPRDSSRQTNTQKIKD